MRDRRSGSTSSVLIVGFFTIAIFVFLFCFLITILVFFTQQLTEPLDSTDPVTQQKFTLLTLSPFLAISSKD